MKIPKEQKDKIELARMNYNLAFNEYLKANSKNYEEKRDNYDLKTREYTRALDLYNMFLQGRKE